MLFTEKLCLFEVMVYVVWMHYDRSGCNNPQFYSDLDLCWLSDCKYVEGRKISPRFIFHCYVSFFPEDRQQLVQKS